MWRFEVLCQLERVGRTRVFAQSAGRLAQSLREIREFLAASLLISLAGNNDEMLGTRRGTKVAGNAKRLVRVRVDIEPGRATIPFGHLRALKWILLRVNPFWILVAEKSHSDP